MARTPLCKECGSDNVTLDANATWDADKQEWILLSTFYPAYCCDCDKTTELVWEDT